MSDISTNYSEKDQTLTINVVGRFEFSLRSEFRDCYKALPKVPKRYVINMQDVSYIDSTGLGMLLLLRDHAGGKKDSVTIQGCNGYIKKTLETVKFQDLFDIQATPAA